MIITIQEVIDQLEKIKAEKGNIFVRTACQVKPHTVDFSYYVDKFYNEDKSVSFDVLIIEGYKK